MGAKDLRAHLGDGWVASNPPRKKRASIDPSPARCKDTLPLSPTMGIQTHINLNANRTVMMGPRAL